VKQGVVHPEAAASEAAQNTALGVMPETSDTAPVWKIADWGVAEWFVVSQTLLPALLFLPGTQAIRLPLRIAVFASSVGVLVWLRLIRHLPSLPYHPARSWLLLTVIYLVPMILHPTTNSLGGALAQITLYFCVMSPLFWVPDLVRSPEALRRLVVILLVTNGLNATVGVLQVYDPDTWLPEEFSRIVTESRFGLGPVSYMGPNGQRIIRPPGLFDTPGAVAGPGMFAALLGVIFAASPVGFGARAAAGGLGLAGVTAIYLSQVRISLVVLAGMLVAYVGIVLRQGRTARATILGTLLTALVGGGLVFASMLGGQSVIERVFTLFESDPLALYYASRGNQLVYTFSDLALTAPFGSGLGRWGMAAGYFSDPTNLDSPSLWAEIQLNGWLIDGGLVIVLTYSLALLMTGVYEWRIATVSSNDRVRASGAVIFAANLGVAVMAFSFTPFVSQVGVQYWFLAGALHGVALHSDPRVE